MNIEIAVPNSEAWNPPRWDVIDFGHEGTIVAGNFVIPFASWDDAVRRLTAIRDKARQVDRGEVAPDADHEVLGGDT